MRSSEERRGFGLWAALILSVLLHAILVLLTVWVPITRGGSVAVAEERDDTIRFTFDRSAEPTTRDPDEDARFTPVEPQPVEQPAVQPTPVPRPPAPESPPVETPRAEIAPAEPPPQARIPEEEEEPAPVEESETESQPGADLPERPDGEFRQAPPESRGKPRDMDEALRSFGRALAGRPPPEPSPREAEAPPENVVVPELNAVPSTGFGVGNLVFESRDYDWNDYGRQVYMAIWRAWHRRLYVTTDDFEKWAYHSGNWRLDHSSQLRFVIEDNGQVTGIALEAGSGCGPLDVSALDALSEVILPPLPPDFPRDREVVHARFSADGAVRSMRPVLRQLKLMGYF